MREILFRGKRLELGDWVEGTLILYPDLDCYIATPSGYNPNILVKVCVAPCTVGQCTGLKDKNGKRIFEGDVCRFEYTGENRGVEGVAAVTFESGKFGVEWGWHKEFVCLDGFANTTIEIIGNIYDNPELLEGGYSNG